MTCGICGRSYKNEAVLAAHGSRVHNGVPRGVWQPGWVDKRTKRPAVAQNPPPTRVFRRPILHGEKPTQAEQMAGLPWVTYPKTVQQCSAIADDCLGRAEAAKDETLRTFWLSLREFIISYGARLERLETV